jgi:hypothetical protein
MKTERDDLVISYLTEFKAATTTTLSELFYPSLRIAQRRLKALCEDKQIKRTREHINTDYIYYIKKPKQLKHRVLLTNFHREAKKIVDIAHFETGVKYGGIIPDGFIAYSSKGKNYIAFIEIQISNWPLNLKKYKMFNYREYFPVMPLIIVISNKQMKGVLQIKEDLSNIREVLG